MENHLLKIQELNVDFPLRKYTFHALKNININLDRGEIIGLVGESGAGKSTVGNAIINLLPSPGYISKGSIKLKGEEISNLNKKTYQKLRGRKIGFIFQDPMTSLNPLFTVGEQLTETILTHLKVTKKEARKKSINLLKKVGINDAEERIDQFPHQFSGGMRQRVVIAIALSCNPDVIIADEPTTALDVSVQDQILQLIKKLCKENNVGVVLVTHDIGVISSTTDRVIVMYNGKIVEEGKTKQILSKPTHEYTKALISAVPPSNKKLDRFTNVQYIEKIEENKPIDIENHWLGDRKITLKKSKLEVNNVSIRFLNKDAFLTRNKEYFYANKNISFQVSPGQTFGIVGESGSGKSTIARAIAGIYPAYEGKILLDNVDITKSNNKTKSTREKLQMIFQNPYASLSPRMKVGKIIEEPMKIRKLLNKNDRKQIAMDLISHVGMKQDSYDKYPHEFSGGQRQRISIARALASRPRFLICDEPTSALDVSVQAQILNLLKDLQQELGLTMLFISHDLPVIRQMCDEIAVMKAGKLIELQDSEKLFTSPKEKYTKELLKLMPRFNHYEYQG